MFQYCGMKGDGIAEAPQLWKVRKSLNDKIALKNLEGFSQLVDSCLFAGSSAYDTVVEKRAEDGGLFTLLP